MSTGVCVCMPFASLQYSFIYRFNCHLPTHQIQNKQINENGERRCDATARSCATVSFNLIHCHNEPTIPNYYYFRLIGNGISATICMIHIRKHTHAHKDSIKFSTSTENCISTRLIWIYQQQQQRQQRQQ